MADLKRAMISMRTINSNILEIRYWAMPRGICFGFRGDGEIIRSSLFEACIISVWNSHVLREHDHKFLRCNVNYSKNNKKFRVTFLNKSIPKSVTS